MESTYDFLEGDSITFFQAFMILSTNFMDFTFRTPFSFSSTLTSLYLTIQYVMHLVLTFLVI